jgi:hypothetical protein
VPQGCRRVAETDFRFAMNAIDAAWHVNSLIVSASCVSKRSAKSATGHSRAHSREEREIE